ncbi:hypothetical protein Tco_0953270 [Tanacetum coccineum]|uniref:Uncharacterized protein n=1 Tax=Tanacetum coccineum TaxID=301880 RepID=A0ABQ5DZE4_9ASTR
MEARRSTIQTILLGLPEDIYDAVDSCEYILRKSALLCATNDERMEYGMVTIVHQTKDLITTDYTTVIAQPGMNMGQDRQMRMVGANGGNQFRQYAGQNGVLKYWEMENVVAARACGCNAPGYNVNQIKVLQRQRIGRHLARTVPSIDIGLPQMDNAPYYDSDRAQTEVHNYDNCYDNEIFNMFTQEEQYTELLEPIPEQTTTEQTECRNVFLTSRVWKGGGNQ